MQIPVDLPDLLFLLAPALIALLTRPAWCSEAKFLTAFGVCFIAALAQVILTGQGEPIHLGVALGKALGLTLIFYAGVWKAFLPKALTFLENRGNVGPAPPPAPRA